MEEIAQQIMRLATPVVVLQALQEKIAHHLINVHFHLVKMVETVHKLRLDTIAPVQDIMLVKIVKDILIPAHLIHV
jgi:hypothetical protein